MPDSRFVGKRGEFEVVPPPDKKLTPLTDQANLRMEVVGEEEGYSVEDAYRILSGQPPTEVDVPREE